MSAAKMAGAIAGMPVPFAGSVAGAMSSQFPEMVCKCSLSLSVYLYVCRSVYSLSVFFVACLYICLVAILATHSFYYTQSNPNYSQSTPNQPQSTAILHPYIANLHLITAKLTPSTPNHTHLLGRLHWSVQRDDGLRARRRRQSCL